MDRPNEGSVRLLRARVLDGEMTEEDATAILKGKSPFSAQGKLAEMWHTPTASDRDGKPKWDHRASPGHVRKVPVPNLMAQVLERWTKPTSRDHKDTGENTDYAKLASKSKLAGAVMFPTPQANDNRDRGNLSMPSIQRRASIGKQLLLSMVVDPTSGSLNPTWVEWLMGFPLGWTDLGHSATRSSRRSSNG
jgi:hypothetical protein